MSTFVDIGWGVDTVQMVLPEIFNAPDAEKLEEDSTILLDSKNILEKRSASATDERAQL